MENMIFCQCCGMPLNKEEDFGTNKDDSKNEEYCKYCFQKGKFTAEHVTMEEMIEGCIPFMVQANANMTEEKARSQMMEFFPTLKRWKKD